MQARINSTEDLNKQSYLKAIADYIINSQGSPVDWGSSSTVPTGFGLASSNAAYLYELDVDKVCRLNSLNNCSLSYFDIANSTGLGNLALGITVLQLISINIELVDSQTIGNNVSYTFEVSTSENSKPISTSLHCYVAADNHLDSITNDTSSSGIGYVTVEIPSASVEDALLVVFARASFDQRATSYAVYNFASSAQESTPSNTVLTLSPLDYKLNLSRDSVTIQKAYVFSYTYQSNLTTISSTEYAIPRIIDKSSFVLVICGLDGAEYFQEWVSYPQVPLSTGANFERSEQNIFSYLVTIKEALYRMELSFGDVIR